MSGDFEQIPEVKAFAIGKVGQELAFSFPEVQEVIQLCSMNKIAVLGVELFQIKADVAGNSKLPTQQPGVWTDLQRACV